MSDTEIQAYIHTVHYTHQLLAKNALVNLTSSWMFLIKCYLTKNAIEHDALFVMLWKWLPLELT